MASAAVEPSAPSSEGVPRRAVLFRRPTALIRRLLGRVPVPVRVWVFTLLLSWCSVVLFVTELATRASPPGPLDVPWPFVALGFALAELKVVDVSFRREKHSFSLSEFPAVIGLFLLSPADYVLAVLVGSGVALGVSRQPPLKLAFNLANFAASAVLTLSIFYALTNLTGAPSPGDWIGAFVATLVATAFSATTIATAITLSGGAPQFQKLPEMIQFGGLVAIANTSLALLAVSIIWTNVVQLWLLVVPLATVFFAYQAYLSEREKHERLELLYQSSRILQRAPELDSALVALLEHARNMFRAERAEILLYPRVGEGTDGILTTCRHDGEAQVMVPLPLERAHAVHRRVAADPHAFLYEPQPGSRDRLLIRQAMVAPLAGEAGLVGAMVIANRLTEGTSFGGDDLKLLETIANQAAVALENGQLEQSLAELSRLKEQLRYQAYHDSLTNLANRFMFTELVDARLATSSARLPVVLFLDLDDFKVVNDTLGHAAGDRLLVAAADRVRGCVRESDVAARLGGDEFAVLLEDEPGLTDAIAVASRIVDAFRITFPIQGHEVTVSVSIGIAAGIDTPRADNLLRNADVAMYMAKAAGKGRFAVFEPTMHAAIVARHALSAELTKSVSRDQLLLAYQPIVRLATNEIAGVEVLVRWRHATHGILGPDAFIRLAEENGVILALGRWVLERACTEVGSWHRSALVPPDFLLTVNVSAAQIQHAGFVQEVMDILEQTAFPASSLALEVTETVMFQDTQTTIARLQQLRRLGIRIALDDFGTGYSSLGYLRRFPVDMLKIAREFVGPTSEDTGQWPFAHAIVALGRTLGLQIVAEGIEDPGQLDRLRDLDCEYGQGYLFARPVDAASISAMLRQSTRLDPPTGVPDRPVDTDVPPAPAAKAPLAAHPPH